MVQANKQIIINADDYETRIATLEEGQLVDLLLERAEIQRMLGNIYRGKVKSVHKGMQAAFVDIGDEANNAFLYVDDMDDQYPDGLHKTGKPAPPRNSRQRSGNAKKQAPRPRRRKIEDLLKNGQEVLLQIVKEPIGTKGPRATTRVSLPGRYTVFVPHENYIGVSKKIAERKERKRLRTLVEKHKPSGTGIIVRTEGENISEKDLAADIKELARAWGEIKKKGKARKKTGLVEKDLGITLSFIRDSFTDEIGSVVVDSRAVYHSIIQYLKSHHAPQLAKKVSLYKDKMPIFDQYKLEDEIDKMLKRKVWCRKGGYLIIDRTEAMSTIDVNSGRYSGAKTHQQSILQTNLHALNEIVRQIRLRDIGGLIVIDFVDMADRKNRKRIQDEMGALLKKDKAKYKVLPINDLGLMIISRQRVKESVPFKLSEVCSHCEGLGRVVSNDTIGIKLERGLKKFKAEHREKGIILTVHPDMKGYLTDERVEEWERQYRMMVTTRVNEEFKYNQFEIEGTGKKSTLMAILDSLF